MKRAFVTGGSGFVGRALIRELVSRGIPVHALARSESSAIAVRGLGAEPVRGDLDDVAAMQEGMADCDVVFHAAAHVEEHGKLATFMRITVGGTENTLKAAQAAGVARFVHVSTEAVIADGQPIINADETRPYPEHPAGPYSISKGAAERVVVAANAPGFTTVVIRPRFIWGKDDTSLMPKLADAVKSGRFAWIGGGHYLTSTCNIANVIEGAILAAEQGAPGGIYFLTDGPPVDFRDFMTQMFEARGVPAVTKSLPRWVASATASLTGWMKHPPVTKQAMALISHEVTVDDAKARRELGYTSHLSREVGLQQMRDEKR